MTTTVYAPHKPDAAKLSAVIAEMRRLGAPTIAAVWRGDHWAAIEGSHRLAAAAELGLAPTIEPLWEGAIVTGHDIDGLPQTCTAGEIVEYLYDRPEVAYQFDGIEA